MEILASIAHNRFAEHDAWSREARRLIALAADLQIPIDHEALILSDVRDLQARIQTIRRRAPPSAGQRRNVPSPPALIRIRP
jgi:hypothetical protein